MQKSTTNISRHTKNAVKFSYSVTLILQQYFLQRIIQIFFNNNFQPRTALDKSLLILYNYFIIFIWGAVTMSQASINSKDFSQVKVHGDGSCQLHSWLAYLNQEQMDKIVDYVNKNDFAAESLGGKTFLQAANDNIKNISGSNRDAVLYLRAYIALKSVEKELYRPKENKIRQQILDELADKKTREMGLDPNNSGDGQATRNDIRNNIEKNLTNEEQQEVNKQIQIRLKAKLAENNSENLSKKIETSNFKFDANKTSPDYAHLLGIATDNNWLPADANIVEIMSETFEQSDAVVEQSGGIQYAK